MARPWWMRASVASTLLLALTALAACSAADRSDEPAGAEPPSSDTTSSAPPTESPATESPTASPTEDAGPTSVLFFGDSYVVGGGYTEADDSMAALAADRLGWKYYIAGGGGTGFVTGNPDFGLAPFPEQIAAGALDVGPVDWVVIEGGGNDDGIAPDRVTQAALGTLQAAAEQHPEARLVLVASMDPTVEDFGDTDGVTGALAEAAAEAEVPFVDGQRWLEGRPDLVGPDFDHPLPEGHVLCGEQLAAALGDLA